MDLLGFTLSVWTAIALGVVGIALVWACIADRSYKSWIPKWFILGAAAIAFVVVQWGNLGAIVQSPDTWKSVGIYLAIGLVYCLIEFVCSVRRSADEWAQQWDHFKSHNGYGQGNFPPNATMEEKFVVASAGRVRHLIGLVEINGKAVPVIDPKALREHLSAWTIFWPFYLISLVLGDLLEWTFDRIALIVTKISGQFVRKHFSNVFKV